MVWQMKRTQRETRRKIFCQFAEIFFALFRRKFLETAWSEVEPVWPPAFLPSDRVCSDLSASNVGQTLPPPPLSRHLSRSDMAQDTSEGGQTVGWGRAFTRWDWQYLTSKIVLARDVSEPDQRSERNQHDHHQWLQWFSLITVRPAGSE